MKKEKVEMNINKTWIASLGKDVKLGDITGTPLEVLKRVHYLLNEGEKLGPFNIWCQKLIAAGRKNGHTGASYEMWAVQYLLQDAAIIGQFAAHLWFADGAEESVPPAK